MASAGRSPRRSADARRAGGRAGSTARRGARGCRAAGGFHPAGAAVSGTIQGSESRSPLGGPCRGVTVVLPSGAPGPRAGGASDREPAIIADRRVAGMRSGASPNTAGFSARTSWPESLHRGESHRMSAILAGKAPGVSSVRRETMHVHAPPDILVRRLLGLPVELPSPTSQVAHRPHRRSETREVSTCSERPPSRSFPVPEPPGDRGGTNGPLPIRPGIPVDTRLAPGSAAAGLCDTRIRDADLQGTIALCPLPPGSPEPEGGARPGRATAPVSGTLWHGARDAGRLPERGAPGAARAANGGGRSTRWWSHRMLGRPDLTSPRLLATTVSALGRVVRAAEGLR